MHGNAWALEKDRAIKRALLLLDERLGGDAFAISHRHDDDFRAVHLCKADEPETLAYLYTYGQPEGQYGLHLEYPDLGGPGAPVPPDVYEGLSLDRLAEILALHFEIAAG